MGRQLWANEEWRNCTNPNHPFKQKRYRWNSKDENSSPEWCYSCAYNIRTTNTMLTAVLAPRHTLYGNGQIMLTREQTLELVNVFYDAYEENQTKVKPKGDS